MASKYHHRTSYLSLLPPLQLCVLLSLTLSLLGLSWYVSYESAVEKLEGGFKVGLVLLPLLLLLALHWLSADDKRRVPLLVELPGQQESLYRAGGSPWGIALVVVVLVYLVSWRSAIQERWFPLLSR